MYMYTCNVYIYIYIQTYMCIYYIGRLHLSGNARIGAKDCTPRKSRRLGNRCGCQWCFPMDAQWLFVIYCVCLFASSAVADIP